MQNHPKKDARPAGETATFTTERRVVRSEDLFGSDREIAILHGGSYYRLQITKAGKLILNK